MRCCINGTLSLSSLKMTLSPGTAQAQLFEITLTFHLLCNQWHLSNLFCCHVRKLCKLGTLVSIRSVHSLTRIRSLLVLVSDLPQGNWLRDEHSACDLYDELGPTISKQSMKITYETISLVLKVELHWFLYMKSTMVFQCASGMALLMALLEGPLVWSTVLDCHSNVVKGSLLSKRWFLPALVISWPFPYRPTDWLGCEWSVWFTYSKESLREFPRNSPDSYIAVDETCSLNYVCCL